MSARVITLDNTTIPTDDGLTLEQKKEIIREISWQPSWRRDAMMCGAFFDGDQLSPETRARIHEMGMDEVIDNKIMPIVNSVLGVEAKSRADWRVQVDADDKQDIAEALSYRMKEVKRETNTDMECSDAFAGQIKVGLGWVFISRNPDPFGYPYRAEEIPFKEMWWDWRARKRDLSDARYLLRQKWHATAAVAYAFPDKIDIIRQNAGQSAIEVDGIPDFGAEMDEVYDPTDWQTWTADYGRSILLQEIWYRVYVRGAVIRFANGIVKPFDEKNPVHAAAYQHGFADVREAPYSKLRVSLWAGPNKLQDVDYGQRKLPYVPFWCYRGALAREPYGIIRNLIPTQREINARRQKLQHLLASKRVIVEEGALAENVNDLQTVLDEVSRPDSAIVMRKDKLNAIRLETDLSLATSQMAVMNEASAAMQRTAGVYNSMMGTADSGATSGRAIQSLVEQGTAMQADINDNYRFARECVGNLLLELIVEDMTGAPTAINYELPDGRKKGVQFNVPAVDENGLPYVENDVSQIMAKTALEDVPSTPAYRSQTMTMIAEVLKGLPGNLQAALTPFFLRSTDLPQREDMAKQIERMLGIQGGEEQQQPDPQKEQMKQLIQQGMQMIQQLQQQLADKEREEKRKDAEVEVRAIEAQARAQEAQARAVKTSAEAERLMLENGMASGEVQQAITDAAVTAAEAALAARQVATQSALPAA
jgi:hypothetical protein